MGDFTVSISKQQDSTITTKLNIKKIYGTARQESAEVGSTEENKLYPYKTTDGVTLELSFEAREKLMQMQSVLHNAGVAKQQGEAMEEAAEDMGKIFTIFRRIANGDIVPPQDEKKLMEYSMEMYQMAKTAAMAAKMTILKSMILWIRRKRKREVPAAQKVQAQFLLPWRFPFPRHQEGKLPQKPPNKYKILKGEER